MGAKGLSITDPRRYAYSLMNIIFGGNMSSRLFQNIRERRGLAYAVFSFITSYIDTGMFGVYAGVDPKNAKEAAALILKEIRKLQEERVDSSELHDAKEYLKGNIMLASENNDNQMVRLAQSETHFGRNIHLQEILDNVEAVTEDEILELAENLFGSNQFALTLLGPVTDKKTFDDILSP